MSNKSKGANAERELYQMFIENCFRAVRVAGSGMMENTSCDLIAGRKGEKYAIECKATKSVNKYITKEQINDFLVFSDIFGLVPLVAIKFNRKGWFFLKPEDLEASKSRDFDGAQKSDSKKISDNTGKYWALSLKTAEKKGKRFGQLFSTSKKSDEELYLENQKDFPADQGDI